MGNWNHGRETVDKGIWRDLFFALTVITFLLEAHLLGFCDTAPPRWVFLCVPQIQAPVRLYTQPPARLCLMTGSSLRISPMPKSNSGCLTCAVYSQSTILAPTCDELEGQISNCSLDVFKRGACFHVLQLNTCKTKSASSMHVSFWLYSLTGGNTVTGLLN